ncbi:MAG: FAD-binding oxidoreductase [Candidatus Rokubacteria bacterium]|nr:FAD-binding oxidoreductase [Candidatus Rokubacteria bacterium]
MTRLTRRQFLLGTVAAGVGASACTRQSSPAPTLVNDVHSQLNPTRVDRVVPIDSVETLRRLIRDARDEGKAISIAGGRHAAGGQQFGAGMILADMTPMNRVLDFDPVRGAIEVEAGIQWPALIDSTLRAQTGQRRPWGIIQKQGVDRISIGGTLSANAHGSGLGLKPFIGDVEAFTLCDAEGRLHRCDRRRNTELFRLAIGGYGLFGVVTSVRLRLAPRRVLQRVVELTDVERLVPILETRTREGFLYANFQSMTDAHSEGFLRQGVLTCYRPADDRAPAPAERQELSADTWKRLVSLAHTDKSRAFQIYAGGLLATSGRTCWSDTHQLATYVDGYHRWLDGQLGAAHPGSEMLVEFFVPRPVLAAFLADVRKDFLDHDVDLIFGTIRVAEQDDESVLAWARWPAACVVFNIHVTHTPEGFISAAATFQRLVDLVIRQGGTYYLTYHRFASRAQVEARHPRLGQFLKSKQAYDPQERFGSDWYRHYAALLTEIDLR